MRYRFKRQNNYNRELMTFNDPDTNDVLMILLIELVRKNIQKIIYNKNMRV